MSAAALYAGLALVDGALGGPTWSWALLAGLAVLDLAWRARGRGDS